jgi:fluoroacetyl-CoA thioesterase
MNTNPIEEGLRLTLEKRVEKPDLAPSVGTSNVPALSSSSLIFFMEKAVSALIAPYLEEGTETVSTEINIKHFRPVGEGALIRCIVHLKFIEENRLYFDVAILDEIHEEIAIGAHCRHIVNIEKFEASFRK